MEKEYFILNGIAYKVVCSSISLYETSDGIQLFPDVTAKNDQVEYELSELHLYHNNGFQTGVKKIAELAGEKYVWEDAYNDKGEEAGFLYVLEHENVTEGTIEIMSVGRNEITLKWTGKANIFWDDAFGADVPFETVVRMKLPKKREVAIDAYKGVKAKVNKDLEIELLNFEEIETAANKMQETRIWTNFNITLNFKVTYKGTEYLGRVQFTNGKNHYETFFDASCPLKVTSGGFDWSIFEFLFTFYVESGPQWKKHNEQMKIV